MSKRPELRAHCVYLLFDFQAVPRWIGVSRNLERRLEAHRTQHSWLAAHVVLSEGLTHAEALAIEARLIAVLGRQTRGGWLLNKATNNSAVAGEPKSSLHRLRIAAANKGKPKSPEARAAMSAAAKRRASSPEWRAAHSARIKDWATQRKGIRK